MIDDSGQPSGHEAIDQTESLRHTFVDRVASHAGFVVRVAEVALAVILGIVAVLGLVRLVAALIELESVHLGLSAAEMRGLLDLALVIFLVVELFRIALAYVAEHEVLPTVIEAVLVAVARKVVLYEFSVEGLAGALALAVLLAVAVVAYFAILYCGRRDATL